MSANSLDGNYREIGLRTYGERCEICGFSIVEVHHIDYYLHSLWEKKIRDAKAKGQNLDHLLSQAKSLGFLYWDGKDLSKDNRPTNLSVLCPNHHSFVHMVDMGKSLLKILPARK